MTQARGGMDHPHYPHTLIDTRPPLRWPGGATLAMPVFLYLEYWELDPPEGSVRDMRFHDMSGYYFPDYRTYSWRDYGNRVGVFRVLDALDRHGLRATVAINAEACRRYPELIEDCARRGYEFAGHGTHATRMISSRMSEDAERAYIAESLDTVQATTGQRPSGWLSQDYGESARTPALLSEAGLDWLCDWPNDDQPYLTSSGPRPMVSLPNQSEWDDVQTHWLRRVPMTRYPQIIADAFDLLRAEGAASGRFFGLHLHPWMIGQPHRIGALEAALEHVCGHGDIWHSTASEIARHARPQLKAGSNG